MKHLYSFDIFDTCLVRTCGEPKYVFDILATKVLGDEAEVSARMDFVLIRMNAEKKAREELINGINEEITLDDIYRFCDFKGITTIDKSIIMKMELDVEDTVLLPVINIKNEIEELVKSGRRVIYISDMYLPIDFIKKKLKDWGFYLNNNIYLSSSIKKTKSSGHLFDYIAKKMNVNYRNWQHKGDNKYSDYIIPKEKGIESILASHHYNQYEIMGMEGMHNGFWPNSTYPFALSRAIRLSFPNTPNHIFAATFVAPMFVSYVYYILLDSRKRGIRHIFFVARDGLILYNIAKEFKHLFPDIQLSYLYASRQAVYMAGLNEVSVNGVKDGISYLANEPIKKILYELHMSSYDYSNISTNGLTGEQIINKLFEDEAFVKELKQKHQEQNTNAIKYFEQEGLTKGNCALVDVVGSRRCQKAINNILVQHHYPKAFYYYFETTWYRITDYEPYLAMNYQEKVINTSLYNRASQPLYEQFFAITNQKRTIEYRNNNGIIEPVFERDFISEEFKQKVYEINKSVCIAYARHYAIGNVKDPIMIIQIAQKAFSYFCHAPRKEFLKAIESFRSTGSGESNEMLLNKRNLLYTITHLKEFYRWPEGQLIYTSGCLYPFVIGFLDYRYKNKCKKCN